MIKVTSILVYQDAKVHSVRYRAEDEQAARDGYALSTLYVPNGIVAKLRGDNRIEVPGRLKVTIEVEE